MDAMQTRFKLSDGPHKHVVSFSGGLASWGVIDYLFNSLHSKYHKDIVLLFADTLIEDEDLYRFNKDVEAYYGTKITVVKDGRHPWQVFRDVNYQGNNRRDPCSKILKRDLLWKYIIYNHDPCNSTHYLGMDYNEFNRLADVREKRAGWKIEAPLIGGCIFKEQLKTELASTGIALPRLYDLGFQHNNCGGFCVKSGQAQFALLLKCFPERYAWHEKQQEKTFEHMGKRYPFIRKAVNKIDYFLSMQEFKEWIQSGGDYDKFDWGGCACSY